MASTDQVAPAISSSSSLHSISKPTRSLPPEPLDTEAAAQTQPNGSIGHEPVIASPVDDKNYKDEENEKAALLTPIRAHYLKKSLVSLQFRRELDGISTSSPLPNVSTLSYLGSPFNAPPRDAPPLDLPFLKYMFRQFVLTFPFLASAPKNFFPEKLQPFIASVLSRNLSGTNIMEEGEEDTEDAMRRKVLSKLEKQFSLVLVSATKLVEAEEVVRLTQADLNRLETIARKRQARLQKKKEVFEVNIVCVRAVVDKGRMRSKVHEEFIIRTRRTNFPDVFVSRRYGDFKTLAEELRKRYPEEEVRPPPAKDKSTVVTSAASTAAATSPSSTLMPSSLSSQANDSQESVISLSTQQAIQNIRLAREKNRLTLRAYLNSLLNNPTLGSSPVLLHFLLSNPTKLSRDELEDAHRREEYDRRRDEGRIHFAHAIAARVEGLRGAIRTVKSDAMAKDGLMHIFSCVRATANVHDLPQEYQAVFEWGRISLASSIFQHFVASDDASENFASLKRLHGLMPYLVLRGILKISNPMAMVRGVLDLFLAQPFGGRSLLQRMFTSSLQEGVSALQEDIESVKEKIEDDVICEKIRQFIYAPREIQNIYKADAVAEGVNLLTVVLRSGEAPALTRPQLHRVMRAHRAHAEYLRQRAEFVDSDDDDGPQDEDAWLYEDLTILAKLYSQLRDKEQIIELIFEGTTSELLKDIITIFYSPLAQVYKAASIGDSLSDLQSFINDLIRTVEGAEETNQDNPQIIVQTFIDLVERHEQSFYNFVHKVHAKGEGLFDNLMKWIQLFLSVFREGFDEKVSLEFLLPHTGPDRVAIMKELDDIALYHYKLKLAHEDKLRRRFGRAQNQSEADAEDEAAQLLVNGVVHDLSFGELVRGDAEDMDAAMSDEDDSSDDTEDSDEEEETSESDSESESGLSREDGPPVPPKPIHRASTIAGSTRESLTPQRIERHASQPHHSPHQRYNYRGRDAQREVAPPVHKLRSRSRSIGALKSIFSRNNADAPPVPPLPSYVPQSPLGKPLPPSPLSARSSQDSQISQATPRRRAWSSQNRPSKKKKDKAALELKPPELKEIPNLLPIFVEMVSKTI
ncbi:uncharacterized protein FOMMEDRAFT_89341 [Fomitiporia mediterranea MF3/22]|uniref:uncharacterized protein n=1 Tax=Fomitiporia mediterranea (strain MF3/22) TaxID=694068 RepID=UPI0004408A03|nr:uncharacterized protein FOMMEDRAFT_89341 [Fomitiporia mediterranea MF3/22]EJD01163.1 hypothetical protein FOMMEDRAFT_89341 [Fomitiporia mediterranea MF3/22]